MAVKKYFILILANVVRFFTGLLKKTFDKESLPVEYWRSFTRIIFKFGFFPIYKVAYATGSKLSAVFGGHRGRFFYLLNKPVVIHLLIVVLVLGVTIDSLKAADLREDNYGEKSLVYSLITKEVYEPLTEETLAFVPSQKVFSYLDRSATLENQRVAMGGTATETPTELATLTEGGAAVIKPKIMGSVNPAEIGVIESPTRTGIVNYTVLSGDTLSTIAGKFDISLQTLLWQNNLGPTSVIRPGDNLQILPVSGVAHEVKKGETIGAIAKKYGVQQDEIVKYNNLLSVNDIKVAQLLIVPGGKKVITSIASNNQGKTTVSPITNLFIPPAAPITESGFLWPTSVRRITQYYSLRHTGLDVAGPTGTPLYASDGGTVTRSGWSNGYGYNVVIDHGNGYKTLYGHASKLHVNVGDTVVKGQTIADMGSTGWSTGPHLHFEVIYKGAKQNPLSYIK